MLEVRIREKSFQPAGGPKRPILGSVAFEARPGEILALLGPSGIGKSTILRTILGLDRDFDGSVRLPQGRIGVLFQEPRLLPWLSVEDNLRLVQPKGVPMPDPEALLSAVSLAQSGRLMPAALSLGMARRVALARALAIDPDTLVLDEPFASLDAALAGTLGRLLTELARQRRTMILLSTHDTGQALGFATRVLVVAGTPATLLADIATPDRADTASLQHLHRDLLQRFTFLSDAQPDARLHSLP